MKNLLASIHNYLSPITGLFTNKTLEEELEAERKDARRAVIIRNLEHIDAIFALEKAQAIHAYLENLNDSSSQV